MKTTLAYSAEPEGEWQMDACRNKALESCRKAGDAIRGLDIMKGRQGSFSNVTASIGIAECPTHGRSPEELLDRADKALYAAKEAGRDRAVLYTAGKSE